MECICWCDVFFKVVGDGVVWFNEVNMNRFRVDIDVEGEY